MMYEKPHLLATYRKLWLSCNRKCERHGTWRTYTPVEGLAGLQVEHIAEDAEGYLWFATVHGGVSRQAADLVVAVDADGQ